MGQTRTPPKDSKSQRKASSSVDPQQAERMALLQLRVGRSSHLYGMAASIGLAASGIILLLTQPGRPLEGIPRDARIILPWFIPILTGAFISTAAIHLKWRPYSGSRISAHFLMTLFAFIISTLTLLSVIRLTLDGLDVQRLTWLYPTALSGISLVLISMAMTWRGMGRRKLLSILAAAFPMGIFVYAFTPIFSDGIPPDLLILTFMGSAVAVQFSGSMLHIIATSTSVQAKEMIRVSNDRLQLVQEQLASKTEALDYKEDALMAREGDLEVQEHSLESREKGLVDVRKEVEAIRAKAEKDVKDLGKQEEKLRSIEADLAAREETLALKEKDLQGQEKDIEKTMSELTKQRGGLAKKENQLERSLDRLKNDEKTLLERSKEVEAAEKELSAQRDEVQKLREEILQKEGDLQLRESALELRGGVPLPEGASEAVAELKKVKARLLEKQKELSQREVHLRTGEERLKGLARKAEEWKEKADKRLGELKAREKEVEGRESSVSERESRAEERWNQVQSQLEVLEKSVRKLKEKEDQYQELTKKAHSKATSVAQAEKDVSSRESSLAARESKIEEVAKRLVGERDTLSAKEEDLLRRRKDLEARESELKLREMEMEDKLRRTARMAGAQETDQERERALELWEKRLKDKEREIKARLYEKEKELQEREKALREGVVIEVEEEPVGQVSADRIKSGTPRLDDLLMGGIPLSSQILFVGPPFVGKEVGILNFIAEGLKEGVPCILVTTARPPAEIAKEMGPILPSFMEYEQLGLVRWVDGSAPAEDTKGKSPSKAGGIYLAQGAGDYDGILKAVESIEAEFNKEEYPYFRLAYMTLSTSLTQGNEKSALSFVQRMVNHMRKAEAVGVYAVERGMHADQLIEALEHQMDGAIHFKSERQKNLLAVAGICEVQTRDWVEYKHTNRALMIGSFMLERIR